MPEHTPTLSEVLQSRRESCRLDLLKFLTTYFPASTGLCPFGEDHVKFIARLQSAVLEGGRFANACYRGFAKTTISENTAIWATIYGHRKFVPIFSADASQANAIIESIKRELAENELLAEDFPEVCHACVALENKSQRCRSQTCCGVLTHVEWMTDRLVLPTIAGAPSSGAIIIGDGVTGSIRGLKHKRPDGTQQRPDFAICDDIQSDESAGSELQINKRMKLIRKTILRAAGHGKTMAAIVNGTLIRKGDVMHQLTDHEANPDFQSERIPLVKKFADAHKTLWLTDYKTLRMTYDKDVIGDQARAHELANKFYADHREVMDAGCGVSWESCFDHEKELSAVQHSYNILIDDGEEVFASECQQEPLVNDDLADGAVSLSPNAIACKLNRYPAGIIPAAVSDLVAMIDVQQSLLFWLVAGFDRQFNGFVTAYGSYPDQRMNYFSLGDAQRKLQDVHPGKSLEATLWAGLDALTKALCGREWKRDDGSTMRLSKLLIDANWGPSTDTIYEFCRQSPHAAFLLPSHGHYIGASSKPMIEYTRKPGERFGPGWMIPLPGQRPVRHVTFDSNYWKTFLHNRLFAPFGETGCVSVFGEDPRRHQMLADHITAEYFVPTMARGRVVNEWKIKPHNPDNHWLDCAVGCCVAASITGCALGETGKAGVAVVKKLRRSEAKVSELKM